MNQNSSGSHYPFVVGDRVQHYQDSSYQGVIMAIDTSLTLPTTCEVLWDGCDVIDVQWSNKLIPLE